MPRSLSSGFRTEIENPNAQDVIVIFATVSHPTFDTPFYVCNDVQNYVYNGNTFSGVGFNISLVTDDDNPPQAKGCIPNVDRRIGEALLSTAIAPQIKIELLVGSDFDNSTPRQPIGTPTPEYTAPSLFLRNVQWDANVLSGDLLSYDLTTEPWPAIRTTPSATPALFR